MHRDAHPVRKRVRRIGNHGIGWPDAGQDFDRVAEVMPKRHPSKFHLLLTVHHAHLRTLRLKEDGAGRQDQRYDVERELKVHVRVGSR